MPNIANTLSDKKSIDRNGMLDNLSGRENYPFGSLMDGRIFGSFRFGFNGMEKDDEVVGPGGSNTVEFWQYDSRLGRRWNIDPVVKPWESPYACFANNPILYIDSGCQIFLHYTNIKDKSGKKVKVKITFDGEVVKIYNKATEQ